MIRHPLTGLCLTLWVGATAVVPALAAGGVGVGDRGDPFRAQQWALDQIGAAKAWPVTTGKGVRIGVVDTGIDLTHEDLADKVVASTNCVGSKGDPAACSGSAQDLDGHGTVVSGIAAADTGNGRGIAGVAPGAELVVARALGGNQPTPIGTPADVNAAIRWVVDHGARVVNLSLGVAYLSGRSSASPLASGLGYAWDHGAIPVVASGNVAPGGEALADTGYVGVNVVVVGATGRNGNLAPYSRPFPAAPWGLVAPGGSGGDPSGTGFASANVLSSAPGSVVRGGYAYAAGTSLAAPHVSGALALLLAEGMSSLDAVQHLLKTADRSRACGTGCNGRLDVGRAATSVAAAAATATPVPSGAAVRQPPPVVGSRAAVATGAPATSGSGTANPDPGSGLDGADEQSLPTDAQPTLAANVGGPEPRPQEASLPGTLVLVVAAGPLVVGAVVRRWVRLVP